MKLQEKHLEAIENNIPIEGSLYSDAEKAAEASAQITKDYMKRFAEWFFSIAIQYQRGGTYVIKHPEIDCSKTYTIDELIEIFLETEK